MLHACWGYRISGYTSSPRGTTDDSRITRHQSADISVTGWSLIEIRSSVLQTDQCDCRPFAARRVGAILASVFKADFALAVRKAFQAPSAR
jgi:hypothetical protein